METEWQIIDTALHAYNKVGVSLYDTLGKDSVGMFYNLLSSFMQVLIKNFHRIYVHNISFICLRLTDVSNLV